MGFSLMNGCFWIAWNISAGAAKQLSKQRGSKDHWIDQQIIQSRRAKNIRKILNWELIETFQLMRSTNGGSRGALRNLQLLAWGEMILSEETRNKTKSTKWNLKKKIAIFFKTINLKYYLEWKQEKLIFIWWIHE